MVGLPGCWRPVTLVTRDPSSCLLCGVFPIPKSLHQAFPHHWVWKVSPHFSLCCQEFWVQMNWCASGLGPKARLLPCFPERPQLRSRSLALTGYKCRPNLVDDLDCFKGHGILWVKWTSLLAVSLISWEMATLYRAFTHLHTSSTHVSFVKAYVLFSHACLKDTAPPTSSDLSPVGQSVM